MDKSDFSNFLLGLGVGVGLGMLFAPKSGAETRTYLRERAGEGGDYLRQRSSDLRENAGQWVERGKEAIGRQRDTISDAVQAGKQAYREAIGRNPGEEPAR